MPYAGGDRIKEISNNPGAGSFVLSGAVVGETVRAFSSAEDGQYLRYLAKHSTAAEAEIGAGLYTHSTRTLTRLHRSYPSEGASVVTFSAGVVHVADTPSVRDVMPFQSTIDPTANDDVADGHLRGNEWINTVSGAVFTCVTPAPGAAVWSQVNSAGTGTLATQAEAEAGTNNTAFMSSLRVTQNVTARVATQGEAEAGTDNTKLITPLRNAQAHAARQALAPTGFNPASVLVDDDADYNTYVQSGAVGFAKASSGTFRRGKTVVVVFDSDGSALTWTADFENFTLGAPLPTALPDGLHTFGFRWNSHRSKIQVAIASLFVDGAILGDYSELVITQTGVTGAVTLSATRKKQSVTHGAGNITPLTITGWPGASGFFSAMTVDWKQDGVGGRTVATPTGGVWAGGTPTFDTAANKTNRVTYTTENSGTTIVMHYGGSF